MSHGPLPLLYCDDDLVAVAKPSGLLVHRGGWGTDDVAALGLVRDALGAWVYPVHRLDRATSGVLLFARSPAVAAIVHEAFEAGRADKVYLALVRGHPPASGSIDHPIPRREDGPRVSAVTEFETLASAGRFGLVAARPRTGRLHQVRRHLKHLGHPLIGDVNYGRGELNRLWRAEYGLMRLGLHAAALTIAHPTRGEAITVRAPLPDDLRLPLLRAGFAESQWSTVLEG